jgi:hypothetical protein
LLATAKQHVSLAADRVPSTWRLVATPLVVPKHPLMITFVVNKVQLLATLWLISSDFDLKYSILREGIRYQEVYESRLPSHGVYSLLTSELFLQHPLKQILFPCLPEHL